LGNRDQVDNRAGGKSESQGSQDNEFAHNQSPSVELTILQSAGTGVMDITQWRICPGRVRWAVSD
jgi:hypothetical protein